MTPTTAKRVALASVGGLALGSLLPWITITAFFGTISAAGTKGDGRITLGLAAAIAAIVVFTKMDRVWRMLAFLAALAAAATWAYDAWNISSKSGAAEARAKGLATVDVGIGLWICAASAVVAVVVFGMQLRSSSQPPTNWMPPAPSARVDPMP